MTVLIVCDQHSHIIVNDQIWNAQVFNIAFVIFNLELKYTFTQDRD